MTNKDEQWRTMTNNDEVMCEVTSFMFVRDRLTNEDEQSRTMTNNVEVMCGGDLH